MEMLILIVVLFSVCDLWLQGVHSSPTRQEMQRMPGSFAQVEKKLLTEEAIASLTEALRRAYREECKGCECSCITRKKHDRRLASR